MNKDKFYFFTLLYLLTFNSIGQEVDPKNAATSSNCDAGFSITTSGLDVQFIHNNPDTALSYLWNFGDGSLSNLKAPVHTYSSYGEYTACLSIVSHDQSCSDSFCDTIEVSHVSSGQPNIKGTVTKFDGQPLMIGNVIAYKITPGSIDFVPIDTVQVDTGKYEFHDLEKGTYVLRSRIHPIENGYYYNAPAYLSTAQSDEDRLYWHNTYFIKIENKETQVHDFALSQIKTIVGKGRINGTLYEDNQLQTPMVGQVVLLLNEDKIPVGVSYSNKTGEFSFTDLPQGKYFVEPEVPGFFTDRLKVNINDPYENIYGIYMFYDGTKIRGGLHTSVEDISNTIDDLKLYPNPTNSTLTITSEYFSSDNNPKITILDAVGRQQPTNGLIHNGNNINIDVSELPEGIYFVSIGDFYMPVRFVKFN